MWLGWILFNGGSSAGIVAAKGKSASLAIVNTILAPSAAGVFTFIIKKYVAGSKNLPKTHPDSEDDEVRMDFQALCNGILAGLVSITANCDAVETWAAVIIGLFGSLFYCLACRFMNWLMVDDPLEAT